MAKQTKPTHGQTDEKKRRKTPVGVTHQPVGTQLNVGNMPGLVATKGGDSITSQVSRLSDSRLSAIQRQVLATQIGQTYGNQHLERMVTSLNKPAIIQREGEGGVCEATAEAGVCEPRWSDADRQTLFGGIDPQVITLIQAVRVEPAIDQLEQSDYELFRSLLDRAGSTLEWLFICKALAAHHSVSEIETFAATIQGMSERWLKRNLSVVNTEVQPDQNMCTPDQQGIMQQYGNSCGPTSVQLIHARTDPIYALSLRSAGPIDQAPDQALSDPSSIMNPALAGEQQGILNAHNAAGTGNAPTNRTNPTGGAWIESNLDALSDATGLTYTTKIIGTQANNITLDQALLTLTISLALGITVPIVVGGSQGDTAHYVVAMQKSGDRYQIHDVATGDTVWRTDTQFRNNALNLPSGHTMLTAVDVPGPAPQPNP